MEESKVHLPMSIAEFYKGKSILLTGFTGVLGKLLVEKLLYSCSELDTIYVLIRAKKGQTPQQRVEQVFSSKAFTRLREKYPGMLESKVVGVAGDMMEERLGLSQEDEQLLRREVSIILHGAASVRFDDPLDFAVRINTLGTKRMVDLALTMPSLVCFTYISTAFSNCDHLHIEEKVYPPKADWRKTVEICDKIHNSVLEPLVAKYIDKMPNTYSFSKSLAEQVINDHRDQLPVLIVRPSSVYFSSKEPSIGWVDNQYGCIGPFLGVCFGLIRCIAHKRNLKINNIPSDIVVNAVIAATWETTLTRNVGTGKDSATVYNLCTPHCLVPSIEEVSLLYTEVGLKPYFRKMGITCSPNVACHSDLSYRINVLFRQMLSSYIIDLLLIICRRQPMLVKIRRKIFILLQFNSFFLSNKFTFATTKLEVLMDHMTPSDRITFGWDVGMFHLFKDIVIKFDSLKFTVLKPFFDNIKTYTRALSMLNIVDKLAVYLTYSLVGFFLYYFNIPSLLLYTAVRLVTFP